MWFWNPRKKKIPDRQVASNVCLYQTRSEMNIEAARFPFLSARFLSLKQSLYYMIHKFFEIFMKPVLIIPTLPSPVPPRPTSPSLPTQFCVPTPNAPPQKKSICTAQIFLNIRSLCGVGWLLRASLSEKTASPSPSSQQLPIVLRNRWDVSAVCLRFLSLPA